MDRENFASNNIICCKIKQTYVKNIQNINLLLYCLYLLHYSKKMHNFAIILMGFYIFNSSFYVAIYFLKKISLFILYYVILQFTT